MDLARSDLGARRRSREHDRRLDDLVAALVEVDDALERAARGRDDLQVVEQRRVDLGQRGVAELEAASAIAPIATVQNRFSIGTRDSEDLLSYATSHEIGFIPWRPVADHIDETGTVATIAEAHDATVTQIALAWLLHLSPVVLPIPGTSRLEHLEANTAAAGIKLSDDDVAQLSGLGG